MNEKSHKTFTSLCDDFNVNNIATALKKNGFRKGDIENVKRDIKKKLSGKKRFSKDELSFLPEYFKVDKRQLYEMSAPDEDRKALEILRLMGIECCLVDYKNYEANGTQGKVKDLLKIIATHKRYILCDLQP